MIGDHAYTSAIWYQFPADVQKYILLIIQNSQTPRFFTAYGFINCSLETFKKVRDQLLIMLRLNKEIQWINNERNKHGLISDFERSRIVLYYV